MAEGQALVVQYRLCEKDLFRFNLTHGQYYWRIALLPGVMLVALFPDVLDLINGRGTAHQRWATQMTLLTASLIFVVVASLVWLYYWWDARQTERKILTAAGDSRLEISPEGLCYSDREAQTRVKWSAISRIRLTRDFLCMYAGPIPAYIVPRRAFGSTQEAETFFQTAHSWRAAASR